MSLNVPGGRKTIFQPPVLLLQYNARLMKLQNAILLIFVALLALLVLTNIQPALALAGMALVPVLVIWQVVIALRHKEPAEQKREFDDKWYENP